MCPRLIATCAHLLIGLRFDICYRCIGTMPLAVHAGTLQQAWSAIERDRLPNADGCTAVLVLPLVLSSSTDACCATGSELRHAYLNCQGSLSGRTRCSKMISSAPRERRASSRSAPPSCPPRHQCLGQTSPASAYGVHCSALLFVMANTAAHVPTALSRPEDGKASTPSIRIQCT